MAGRLFGIVNSNRKGANLWGKNQFNSTFPAALACYMRSLEIPAVYLMIDEDRSFINREVDFDFIFGSGLRNEDLFMNFEATFRNYEEVIIGPSERVDLVISECAEGGDGRLVEGAQLRALEVKLTVVPDNSTFSKSESEWGAELVIRPATTKYCAMSIAYGLLEKRNEVRKIFEEDFSSVENWGNKVECLSILEKILNRLEQFEEEFAHTQVPIVMQPIWKTAGKSPDLAENCFDIFVWSNFAILRVIIDQAWNCVGSNRITRQARAALQMVRFFLEFSRSGNAHIASLHAQMTYDTQSDKAFALSGTATRTYMTNERIWNPRISKDALAEIILENGVDALSPERRFDQSIIIATLKKNIEDLEQGLSNNSN